MKTFSFEVFSGGTVMFDHDVCARCETKACVVVCNQPNLACVLELKDNLPALRVTPEEAKSGGCIECLACELDCRTKGLGGVTFALPMPELDAHLETSAREGRTPGFRQK